MIVESTQGSPDELYILKEIPPRSPIPEDVPLQSPSKTAFSEKMVANSDCSLLQNQTNPEKGATHSGVGLLSFDFFQ